MNNEREGKNDECHKTQTLAEKIAERLYRVAKELCEGRCPSEQSLAALIREELLGSELVKAAEEAKRALYRVASVLYAPEKEQLHALDAALKELNDLKS